MLRIVRHLLVSVSVMVLLALTVHAQEVPKLLGAPDIVPLATEAMQSPDFWTSRLDGDPDQVIMTPEQVMEFNRKNSVRPLEHKDVNGKTVSVLEELSGGIFTGISFHLSDPLTIETYPGSELRDRINLARKHVTDTEYWDRRRIPYQDWKIRELVESMNIDAVPKSIKPQYGITVCHTLNRVAPTMDRLYRGQYQWLDMLQNAVLETGMPVAVLHASKDGSWLLIKSEYSLGWVPATNIAIGSKKNINRIAGADDFVVSTAHNVPVYADKDCTSWLLDLYMGGTLPLKKNGKAGYRVAVPFRNHDGGLKTVDGWMKPDADVSMGYQSYTRRNVINTIFKLLNRPYGWGGTNHERDCVGTIRAVYRTFGINMPRWTTYELAYSDHVITMPAKMSKEEKYRYLDSCDPGITVCGFDWHVTLYLGKVYGIHYVIHQNGFSYHDEDGNELRVGKVSVNHTELEGGADINRWTDYTIFKP